MQAHLAPLFLAHLRQLPQQFNRFWVNIYIMHILDLFEEDSAPQERRDEKNDNTALKLSDLRKTRLSLEQINHMRIMNDVRKVEHEEKLKKVHKQYKAAAPEGGAPPAV